MTEYAAALSLLAKHQLTLAMYTVMLEYCSLGSVRDIIETCDIILSEDQIAVVCLNTLKVRHTTECTNHKRNITTVAMLPMHKSFANCCSIRAWCICT